MKLLALIFLLATPAFGWQAVPHEEGTAQRIDGEKISGAAETGDNVYILIEPKQVLPQLEPGPEIAYRNIILNYGDSYICGPLREIKITVDGALVRETDPIEGTLHDWHIFNKGFLTTHYGEVLSFESMAQADGSDLATRLLNAKKTIVFERKIDNCGDDGVFEFGVFR
ncbi:MAG: hypothetical protein ACPHVW_08080 [Parvibaculales bacterium]